MEESRDVKNAAREVSLLVVKDVKDKLVRRRDEIKYSRFGKQRRG
jgi:hypothetical protein